MTATQPGPLLSVRDLRVAFPTRQGVFEAVRGVSFDLGRERLGVVGESGSGKSMTGRAILGLVRPPGKVTASRMEFEGKSILNLPERQMRAVRGRRISMVMQDPKFSLNPVMRVGDQIVEAYRQQTGAGRAAARQRAMEMLEAVRIRDPERVFGAYPHEVSGGMGQRIMIAMMLASGPEILIADEPTSALDVSVRTEVLRIMDDLVRDRGMTPTPLALQLQGPLGAALARLREVAAGGGSAEARAAANSATSAAVTSSTSSMLCARHSTTATSTVL